MSTDSVLAATRSTTHDRELLPVLLIPAAVCLAVVGAAAALDLGLGVIFGAGGLTYAATATVLGLLSHRYRDRLPFRARPIARFELTWLAGWLVGIVTFTLTNAALGLIVGDDTWPKESPAQLFPGFWLLALPFAVVYLVSTPIVHGVISRRRADPR